MTPRRAPIDMLVVDDLRFTVRWSVRRRTVGITVKRAGELVIAAPARTSARRLEAVVARRPPGCGASSPSRGPGPPPEPRQMVAGERFPYLGREYVLTLADGPPSPVALVGGSLEVDRALDGEARSAVIAWYQARAQDCIGEAVARFVPLVGAAPAAVVVRDLGKRRWGVCDHRTLAVSFHWQLVTQPPELIDYVVVHELAHLHEPNHGPAFWRRVADVLPDCRERRKRLSGTGDALTF